MNLAERQCGYEEGYDYKIMPIVPVVIRVDIRNFNKIIRKLPKPYSPELWRILQETMHSTIMEIDGAIFGYQHNGEMVFILRNDLEQGESAFYSNRIQKISSAVASMVTTNFMKNYIASDDAPDIIGEAVFEVNCFGIPSIVETMNYLLYRQQNYNHYAIKSATLYGLHKLFQRDAVSQMITGASNYKMKEMLESECNVIFEERYPVYFRRGSISYKVPRIIRSNDGDISRKKWLLDKNTPDFLDEDGRDFVMNILHTGSDILVPERDIIER
jgi:tRNA(His) 5'-end guanylyltransferase